jgi:sarcosine oxidase
MNTPSKNSFDIIVLGVGSMGSSSCYFLAKQGYKVLGLEQFTISHEFGSHAGQSRVIRKAYFEHPDYIPLLIRAYQNWKQLEKETGEQLYFKTGLVYFGPPDHIVMQGVNQSASLYGIELENVNRDEIKKRFPQFQIPENYQCLFEPDAGFVRPEKTIQLYTELAKKNRAQINTNEKVLDWEKDGDGIVVNTDKNHYHCNKLVITAGAWAGKMIPGFEKKLKITRQFISWIKPKNESDFSLGKFPCWLLADDKKPGVYYGFPSLSPEKFGQPAGLKLSHHHAAVETDPDHVNRQPTPEDEENLKWALNKYFPGVFESFLTEKICLYSNTSDENFIIDKLPGYEDRVVIACGFSGHGFKFVPVVGEILADLVISGKTNFSMEFLTAKRFK